MDKKTNKRLFICAIILAIASFAFFFPKDDTICGALAGGESACSTHRCAGIFINARGITAIHHDCLGFDLGSTNVDI